MRILTVVSVAAMSVLMLCSGGCASMVFHGGTFISNSSQAGEVLVEYKAEGIVPAGVTYALVQTEKGPAILERSDNGSGALVQNHWVDSAGDHFAAWVYAYGATEGCHGFEFVVPTDRSRNALRYVYPQGSYVVQKVDGVDRPIPLSPAKPVTTLIPVKPTTATGPSSRPAK